MPEKTYQYVTGGADILSSSYGRHQVSESAPGILRVYGKYTTDSDDGDWRQAGLDITDQFSLTEIGSWNELYADETTKPWLLSIPEKLRARGLTSQADDFDRTFKSAWRKIRSRVDDWDVFASYSEYEMNNNPDAPNMFVFVGYGTNKDGDPAPFALYFRYALVEKEV